MCCDPCYPNQTKCGVIDRYTQLGVPKLWTLPSTDYYSLPISGMKTKRVNNIRMIFWQGYHHKHQGPRAIDLYLTRVHVSLIVMLERIDLTGILGTLDGSTSLQEYTTTISVLQLMNDEQTRNSMTFCAAHLGVPWFSSISYL